MDYDGQQTVKYINAVPENGYLTVVIGSTPYYPSPLSVVWSSGFSVANCLWYASALGAASTFPNENYFYNVVEQNSNSFTHALLVTQTNILPWWVNLAEAVNPLTPGWLWPLSW